MWLCSVRRWLEKMSNLMIFSLASARTKYFYLWRVIQAFSFAFFATVLLFSVRRLDLTWLTLFGCLFASIWSSLVFVCSVARLENYFCNEIWYLYQQKKKQESYFHFMLSYSFVFTITVSYIFRFCYFGQSACTLITSSLEM